MYVLWHVINKTGLHPLPEAIKNTPTLSSVQELKSYLGLLTHYGKFLPNLSATLLPLYRLLRFSQYLIHSSFNGHDDTDTVSDHIVGESSDRSRGGGGHVLDGVTPPCMHRWETGVSGHMRIISYMSYSCGPHLDKNKQSAILPDRKHSQWGGGLDTSQYIYYCKLVMCTVY